MLSMNNLNDILVAFAPINLKEMDHVKLLDRLDTKFVVHESQLPALLAEISDHYRLLVIDGELLHAYETQYFDTPDFHLYMVHHNGKRNRFKVRFRQYVHSGDTYFEVKSKTNTGRTFKNRLKVDSIPEVLTETQNHFIALHAASENQSFVPSLRIFFDRLTLVNKNANERLTFDLNLRYLHDGSYKSIKNMIIGEVKQEKHAVSPFRELMKGHRQANRYLSKYCMGIIIFRKELKKNRFKQTLKSLNKLGYDIY